LTQRLNEFIFFKKESIKHQKEVNMKTMARLYRLFLAVEIQ